MTQVEAIPVRIPRRDGAPAYEGMVVRLRDADGATGAGEAAVLTERAGGVEAAVRVATEIAGLDLRARRAGIRVAELLGGVRRESVECTALVIDPRAVSAAHEVERRAAEGYRAFKLKSANAGGALDGERLGGARWAAGHGARLRLDFNGSLSEARAISMLPTLEHFGLELVEQPLAAGIGVEAWARVQAATGMPLAADESLADLDTACALARAGFVLALKLSTAGGPRAVINLAASATGRVTVGSGMESSLGLAAALHVACALAGEPLACGLATLERLDGDLAGGLDVGPVLNLPSGPGLGVELDEAGLARYRIDR
jgi:muconate cycloisomerase